MGKSPAYVIFFLSVFLLFLSAAHADIYKFVDGDGVIHFSNVPVDQSTERVVKEDLRPRPTKAGPVRDSAERPRAVPAVYTHAPEPVDEDVPYADIINAKCDKYGVDAQLVKAIIKTESDFNPQAVSSKGARGLMQLMPSTASDMGVTDSFDPEQNIDGGVRYFKFLLDCFGGDTELSVAAYNCGQGRVIRNGNCVPEITETKNYVKKVMKFSNNPITGMSFSRPIYKIELKDGSVMFSDSPVPASVGLSIVE